MSDARVTARILKDRGYVNLRGSADDATFTAGVEGVLGQPLPVANNTYSSGEHRVYWLGPDEWLIATDLAGAGDLAEALESALADSHIAINDVSGGNVGIRLSGRHVRELLAKGCTLDFHPREFAVGPCAQSGLAKASVLIGLLDDSPDFEIIVRRSFADYLVKWLDHAGSAYGIEFA